MKPPPPLIALLAWTAALTTGCAGSGGAVVPAATSTPVAAATIVPIATGANDTISLSGAGVSGSLDLQAVSSNVSSGLTVTLSLQDAAPSGFPALQQAARRAAASSNAKITPLFYLQLCFSATAAAGGATVVVRGPDSWSIAGASYDLAYFDPLDVALGWQLGWAGPAQVTGTTLTFALGPATFVGETTYEMGVYAFTTPAPSATPAPTPAPSATPVPSASPAPSATPVPLTVTPASVTIAGPGAGNAQTIDVSEPGYSGALTESDSCNGRVAIASLAPSSGTGPDWHVTATGYNAGTCVATFRDANGQNKTISIGVTFQGFSVNATHRKED
jgi:hypothetical protein